MAWQKLNTVSTTLNVWGNLGVIQGNTLRLSYSFPTIAPERTVRGWIRLRYEIGLYSSEWLRVYPRANKEEIFIFRSSGILEDLYFQKTVEIISANDYPWIVTAYQPI